MGWEDEFIDALKAVLDDIYNLQYELEHCVRGAYTRCDTSEELADYIISLAAELQASGENIRYYDEEYFDEYEDDEYEDGEY